MRICGLKYFNSASIHVSGMDIARKTLDNPIEYRRQLGECIKKLKESQLKSKDKK